MMSSRALQLRVLLLLLPAVVPEGMPAQSLASPFGSVSQKIDSTTITVDYYRPSVRGRAIFGRLVKWGELWTPGANWATTLEVTRDARVEGQAMSSGKYSLWMIPAQPPDSWTVVLSRVARRFHVLRPDPRDDALRFKLPADSAPHTELLTFSFPVVTRTGATLAFRWAGTMIPIRLEILSSRPALAMAHPRSSYTGIYELRWVDEPGAPPVRCEIIDRDNSLWVHTTSEELAPGLDPEFDLLPAGGDAFHPRQYKGGKLIGDEMDELIIFQLAGDTATGFELRGIAEDKVFARATRVTRP